MLAAMWG
jgi:hypothetical protein